MSVPATPFVLTVSSIPHFVVMTAKAKMPSSCWGTYGRVAVVETDGIHMPKQIHPRHNAVVSIRFLADSLFWGSSDRCAFRRAKAEAKELCNRLNAEYDAQLNQLAA